MQVLKTSIADVLILQPDVYEDARGCFWESYSRRSCARLGIDADFVQDSTSFSRKGVLRGLHYQKGVHAQAKLVSAACGRILDAALDIRAGSPTFGQCVLAELTAGNHRQMFIPTGFAHGFVVLSETALVCYKSSAFYAPESEGAVNALDEALAIDWPVAKDQILRSPKDAAAAGWEAYLQRPDFFYGA